MPIKHLKQKGNLKDSTNNSTLAKGFRRVFTSKSLDNKDTSILDKENVDQNNNLVYKEIKSSADDNELYYCEVGFKKKIKNAKP